MQRLLASLLVAVLAAPSLATDKSIGAVKLSITRSTSGARRLTFVSKEANALFPALGGPDDPSSIGASVTLVTPFQLPPTFAIPPGVGNPGWRIRDGSTLDSYRYNNGSAPAGPSVVRSLVVRQNRSLKLVMRDTGLGFGPLRSVGVRLTTGSLRNCALFDAATVLVDEPGRFVAKGAVATGADCDDATLGAPFMCSSYQCRFPGPETYVCCAPDTFCVVEDAAFGRCFGSACRDLLEPCGANTPAPGTCCAPLECVFDVGLYSYCRLPLGSQCFYGHECASLGCIDGVCSAPPP